MNLKEYLDAKGLRPSVFAKAHKISQSIIHKHVKNHQPLRLKSAIRISEATAGEVSVKDLHNYSIEKNNGCQKY